MVQEASNNQVKAHFFFSGRLRRRRRSRNRRRARRRRRRRRRKSRRRMVQIKAVQLKMIVSCTKTWFRD
jgi:hypothetical protein